MTKAIPQIHRYMTTEPFTIDSKDNLYQAKKMMKDHNIRHLPVMEEGKLVGIISERDIDVIQSFQGVKLEKERVGFAMTSEPFIVNSETHLDEVCRSMAADKIGSVLVKDNNKLIGIFTWIDALNAMSDLMQNRLKS